MGHLRSGTVDKFKEAFDKALNSGEGFSAASHKCKETFMKLFDEGCDGKLLLLWTFACIHGFIIIIDMVSEVNMPILQYSQFKKSLSGITEAVWGLWVIWWYDFLCFARETKHKILLKLFFLPFLLPIVDMLLYGEIFSNFDPTLKTKRSELKFSLV